MRRAIATLVVFGVLAAACTSAGNDPHGGASGASGATGSGGATSSQPTGATADAEPADPTGATADEEALDPTGPADPEPTDLIPAAVAPEPDARIPRDPKRLAGLLTETWELRRQTVDAWVSSGGSASWPAPEELELLVLFEQRIYRTLAGDEHLAPRVLERLPRGLAAEARANVIAGTALANHFAPVRQIPDFRIRPPEPAETLRRYFEIAEARFGVPWELLAAVMLVETRMGRIVSRSSAGAQGPMQFLPSTWDAYGLGGDIRDPRDAVLGAANYLSSSGAAHDVRQALYRYNPVTAYVNAVRSYARAIERDPETFYAYYHWQVFVRTTRHGDVRLSGPGLPPEG